jgi:hypothetical protein
VMQTEGVTHWLGRYHYGYVDILPTCSKRSWGVPTCWPCGATEHAANSGGGHAVRSRVHELVCGHALRQGLSFGCVSAQLAPLTGVLS